jgi:hypothetical protein
LEADVKTRVVRYWHETDWLYKVQEERQVTEADQWVTFGGTRCEVYPKPVVGTNYWFHVAGGLSRENAQRIAKARSEAATVDHTDVVAEFGE